MAQMLFLRVTQVLVFVSITKVACWVPCFEPLVVWGFGFLGIKFAESPRWRRHPPKQSLGQDLRGSSSKGFQNDFSIGGEEKPAPHRQLCVFRFHELVLG